MRIGITAGDPAGVGFEVIFKTLEELGTRSQWILFGDRTDFEAQGERFARSLAWSDVASLDRDREPGLWFQPTGASPEPASWGISTAETGRRAVAALAMAGRWALTGKLDGIVTGPLGKRFAGADFRGQTEFLAEQAGIARAAMSFFTPTFKVVLATTHVALAQVPALLSIDRYLELLELTDRELRGLGYLPPRIAVAALNPHGGEGGIFGVEDDRVLKPAVDLARAEGLAVSGPHPADSLYLRAHKGEFDVVLAPYHDQGLIPVKLIAPGSATNVTLGLPYVRTSPDHGTALAIAGRGEADSTGMESACRLSIELIRRRRPQLRQPSHSP